MKNLLSITVLVLLLLISKPMFSQWSVDPLVNNAVCTQVNTQLQPTITGDGSGGVFIAWSDERNGGLNKDIYVQRINAAGSVLWTADGIAINSFITDQDGPSIMSDGSGGAIIAWRDERNGSSNRDIYAQRINSGGTALWNVDGVAVCTNASNQFNPKITSDGSGGAMITWYDARSGNNDIYVQRINSSGVAQWTAEGLAVCTEASAQYYPTISSDGSGGAIITWQDNRSGNSDIFAQKVDAGGATQWTLNGESVCSLAGSQSYPSITGDGSNGAIITWQDARSGVNDIYAQKVNASGAGQWAANGVALTSNGSHQLSPTLISDGSAGAIVTWYDYRNGNADIYAQQINASGVGQWTADGVAVSTNSANQFEPTIVGDGSSGAFITWYDYRNGNADVYAARLFPAVVLPVELISFTCQVTGSTVVLNWKTVMEINNAGFEIERRKINSQFTTGDWEKIGFVPGNGNSSLAINYRFTDAPVANGSYVYRLKQIDYDGKFKYSEIIKAFVGIAGQYALSQNYPNPFITGTVITFNIPRDGKVTLKVFDMLGKEVAILVDEVKQAGAYQVSVNGKSLKAGTYIYRLQSGNYVEIKKMMLIE